MILSDLNIKERIIQEPDKINQAKEWWEKGAWEDIGNSILIEPYDNVSLSPCCYDFTVGEEYVSLRDPEKICKIRKGDSIKLGPGETVLILTQEYVCLPKDVVAMIVPRATLIFEGTSLNSTRIDPTWYGKLLIGFTNLAKNPVSLDYGEPFCTGYFMQVAITERILTRERVRFLGRTNINSLKLTHAKPQKLMSPDRVTREEMEKVVELYGWPWDVVRGMFNLTVKEIKEFISADSAPTIVEEATSAAIKRAYETQQIWMKVLIVGGITVFVAFLGVKGYFVSLIFDILSKLPSP